MRTLVRLNQPGSIQSSVYQPYTGNSSSNYYKPFGSTPLVSAEEVNRSQCFAKIKLGPVNTNAMPRR